MWLLMEPALQLQQQLVGPLLILGRDLLSVRLHLQLDMCSQSLQVTHLNRASLLRRGEESSASTEGGAIDAKSVWH